MKQHLYLEGYNNLLETWKDRAIGIVAPLTTFTHVHLRINDRVLYAREGKTTAIIKAGVLHKVHGSPERTVYLGCRDIKLSKVLYVASLIKTSTLM